MAFCLNVGLAEFLFLQVIFYRKPYNGQLQKHKNFRHYFSLICQADKFPAVQAAILFLLRYPLLFSRHMQTVRCPPDI